MLLHGVKLDFSDMRFGVFGFLQYERSLSKGMLDKFKRDFCE